MARDESDNVYQIELQLTSPKHLSSRMGFNMTQLHSRQVTQGEQYSNARRTFTIWLCTQDVQFQYSEAGENDYDFRFVMYDPRRKTLLNEDFEIHVLLLNRWQKPEQLSPIDEWIYFFTEAKNWSTLPEELRAKHMRAAMKVLEQFSEQKESYYQYLERFNIRAKELSTEAEYRQIQQDYTQSQEDLEQTKGDLEQTQEHLHQTTGDLKQAKEDLKKAKLETNQVQSTVNQLESQLKQNQLNTAKNLIALNTLSNQQIAEATGLTVENIKALKS